MSDKKLTATEQALLIRAAKKSISKKKPLGIVDYTERYYGEWALRQSTRKQPFDLDTFFASIPEHHRVIDPVSSISHHIDPIEAELEKSSSELLDDQVPVLEDTEKSNWDDNL